MHYTINGFILLQVIVFNGLSQLREINMFGPKKHGMKMEEQRWHVSNTAVSHGDRILVFNIWIRTCSKYTSLVKEWSRLYFPIWRYA